MPASRTPAFAKPKSGTMRKALQGAMACSSICNGLSTASGAPGVLRIGTIMAARTPATVACTPDSSTAYQSAAERKSVGEGKGVSVRVELGGRRILIKKKTEE